MRSIQGKDKQGQARTTESFHHFSPCLIKEQSQRRKQPSRKLRIGNRWPITVRHLSSFTYFVLADQVTTGVEPKRLLTLAYRGSRRGPTKQPPKSLDQSPECKQSLLSPVIKEALDTSVSCPVMAVGHHGDSLSLQPKPSVTASLKLLDLGSDRKRKRIDSPRYTEQIFTQSTDEPCRKRRRIRTEPLGFGDAAKQQLARNRSNDRADLVYHWIQEGTWPKHYFEPDEGTTALLQMHRLTMSFPALLVQRSDVSDAPRLGVDPFFLIT